MTNTMDLTGLKKGSGFKAQVIAGHDVAPRRLLYCDTDKTWKYADASSENTMPATVLTLSRIRKGQRGKTLVIGEINSNKWNWLPKKPLYTSKTPGAMTQTRPDSTGDQVQIVGLALTETLILFNPNYVIVEVQ